MTEQAISSGELTPSVVVAQQLGARTEKRRQSNISVVIAQTLPSRLDVFKALAVGSASDEFVIAYMMRTEPGHGATEAQAKRAAYAACVHLDDFRSYDVWCDDKHSSNPALAAGTLHINDMRHSWRADIRSAFQVVNFNVPQSALDDICEDHGAPRVEDLHCPMSDAMVDTVVKNLAMALIPAMVRPEQASRLFFDHAWRAVTAHLARTYGSFQPSPSGRGGLAPWQERRVKEMIMADLSGSLTLPQLANACRLSCSHFSQAFRQTVGCPPHQWLLSQRVERAKQLILNTRQSLSDIALEIGFADQSHFTRVFSQRVKASPAAWRRAQGR